MKIAEMLTEQMSSSEKFTQDNFGLKVGDTYPELVRECVASDKVQRFLFAHFLMSQLVAIKVLDKIDPGNLAAFASSPEIFDLPMAMLYWGIEIGRRLEREQAAALKATSAEPVNER